MKDREVSVIQGQYEPKQLSLDPQHPPMSRVPQHKSITQNVNLGERQVW